MAIHVTDSDIERLSLGKLTKRKALAVQKHLFECGPCLKRLIAFEVQRAERELLAELVLRAARCAPADLEICENTANAPLRRTTTP